MYQHVEMGLKQDSNSCSSKETLDSAENQSSCIREECEDEPICRQEAAGVHRARRGDRHAQRSTASLEAEPEVA